MNAQTELLKVGSAALSLAEMPDKLGSNLKENEETKEPETSQPAAAAPTQDAGIDAKMAAKARKTAQMKIMAIQANKEISDRARTRRIGKVLDEFAGGKE